MSDPRILQLLPALGDGGVERSALEMAEFLSGRGIKNWVASAGGPLVEAVEAAGAVHVTVPVGTKAPWRMISAARAVARLVDAEGIDILHARSRAPAWVALMARCFSTRPVRFLTTFHGVYGHASALKRLYNSAMLRTPVVIANSDFIRKHIVEVYGYPREQIIVAPRGIDPLVFDPAGIDQATREAIRAEFGAGEEHRLIVMVGRITSWKGHAILLDAFARLADPTLRLAFVGSGAASVISELKTQAERLGVTDRLIFAGSRRDVPAVLAAADLAVSASTRPEAFGRAAIEAQAMQTPVIATNHGGSRETVLPSETGWLVEPGDAAAMEEAIRDALADPDRLREMGSKGRAHVLDHFTTQFMLEQEYSAYERIMSESADSQS
ncbi:glycosyltransferase family 4 protein [Ciceribacter sp. L1K23]|uniref:glycosyltransferase family 4 protein n=1 Tax=Ciceribacter sp. L1K23 TaxID=2820276 RepID=UPI001B830B8A|nr:glycosyltransferase family 4 protein [Ciceribacter sp. L1K23]MBR0554960.1 glycosyltransferase family 4 protein [Ciceribacter sp. L1K23]